ncbi:MAG: DUF3048 domain-containing protein [Patescibacteria group bacterium]
MKISFKKENLLKSAVALTALLMILVFYFYTIGNKISIYNKEESLFVDISQDSQSVVIKEDSNMPLNKITGERCNNGDKRPFFVMLAADRVARPLSGISQADLVFEMPVITDGITRYMALFQCEEPNEIGSIRSSRHDFITIAQGFDAIYAHWGGSKFALDKLKEKVINNIDALVNPHDTYFRKKTISAPHNGFTSFGRLYNTAEKLGYRLKTDFIGYPHIKAISRSNGNYEINIPYPAPYNVKFLYSSKSNEYLRFIGGFKEVDKNINKQVAVKNLVIMKAASKQVKDQYNDLEIEDSGEAMVYRNGEVARGIWERKSGKYYFLDSDKKEIEFAIGKIWISIIQTNQDVFINNL